jgi:hypothetical protein
MESNAGGISGSTVISVLMKIVFVVVGLAAIYFLYSFVFSSSGVQAVTIVPSKMAASEPLATVPSIPMIYEGGEYTFNTWLYINSFNRNMNKRKHIFELKGDSFSTVLVALGAMKNSLVVRTHYKDLGASPAGGDAASGATTTPPDATTPPPTVQGFTSRIVENFVEDSEGADSGELSAATVDSMFASMVTADTLMPPPKCDLGNVDLQRWVMLTVVLTGRTIDVYYDGKLERSCVTESYYKVDPNGVKAVVCDRGGFDGYISGMSVAGYAMNPDEIYRTYLSGPEGGTSNILSWATGMFSKSSV